ncbi:MAG: hypothetical protein H7Y88_06210, partial [Phycisphaerales bacterium]|nr:hypothetical protein [Phycisphaerales bacterium]
SAGQTLSATALVHEAYLKLAGPRAAAEAMRRILVDRARAKGARIRGGPEARRAVNLASLPDLDSERESAGFLILDAAIARLEGVDREAAAVIRLRSARGDAAGDGPGAAGEGGGDQRPPGVRAGPGHARGVGE